MKQLIDKIIPPSDSAHRNGFSNTSLIDQINEHEKQQVEDELIYKLLNEAEADMLVVETLAYMKSQKSLPALKRLLEITSYEMSKIIISSSIFEINQDNDMVEIAITSLKKLPNIYYAVFDLKPIKNFQNLCP